MCSEPLRVVEFYAGVGGWHFALKHSGLNASIIAAIDINTTANNFYKYNFPMTNHLQRNICGFTARDLDSFSADVFTLSPPCQPFTRQGKQGDNEDHRTDSFFHLMHIFPDMHNPPKFIMIENVKGFECSNTRDHIYSVLERMNYTIQEFLLSPKQFGIPNSRLRYYLLAKKRPLSFDIVLSKTPCCTVEDFLLQYLSTNDDTYVSKKKIVTATCNTSCIADNKTSDCHSHGYSYQQYTVNDPTANVTPGVDNQMVPLRSLNDGFIESLTDLELQEVLVTDKVLRSYAMGLDIVDIDSFSSCCFTKGYFRYAVGTGSTLKQDPKSSLDVAFKDYIDSKQRGDIEECSRYLKQLQLRYFTPREVSNLMCFPKSLKFPPDSNIRQQYRVLGNSVNVKVVSILLQYLIQNN